jgi:hypothetical protein
LNLESGAFAYLLSRCAGSYFGNERPLSEATFVALLNQEVTVSRDIVLIAALTIAFAAMLVNFG